jgi:phosphoribosylaminoimidazolecarboxamide formyltransferase/IMP cyclohydrolase
MASPLALLSVSDKRGLVDFAAALVSMGVDLLSTGGTAAVLRQAGLPVRDVSDYTGFPEMLDGRVKTLHPRVHAGILACRDRPDHRDTLAEHGITPIDLVVVNLYPFSATVANPQCTLTEAIDQIDIGGPTLLRAAAKNHGDEQGGVAVVTDPDDYTAVLQEWRSAGGRLAVQTRWKLAQKAFVHTARYDSAIANWFSSRPEGKVQPGRFPQQLHLSFDGVLPLRYGENPHQEAAFYAEPDPPAGTIGGMTQIQGKALSYNNIADADAAWECVKSFDPDCPACVIVKHANPCGVAISSHVAQAYQKAFDADPTSAFGGIIALNVPLDEPCARAIMTQFAEVVIAPAISSQAASLLATRQNLRVLIVDLPNRSLPSTVRWDYKRVGGGLLVQTTDDLSCAQWKVVTHREPTAEEIGDLRFAWTVAQFVKSNAIVYCKDQATVGIGAGQMSRVDAARIALIKAENNGQSVRASVVASDAFFPFRDGLDVLAQAGATAVIQPGGSIRDAEVIDAANEQGMAMVFTGTRHFRH